MQSIEYSIGALKLSVTYRARPAGGAEGHRRKGCGACGHHSLLDLLGKTLALSTPSLC